MNDAVQFGEIYFFKDILLVNKTVYYPILINFFIARAVIISIFTYF